MNKKISLRKHTQKGAVAVLVALALPVLIGAAALAVDLAHLHVVRNELQNDADASALAGARKLYASGLVKPDWTSAQSDAENAIGLNHAAGGMLNTGLVEAGYWSMLSGSSGFQTLPMTPKGSDAPAVQVRVSKSGDQNGGAVLNYLASILGIISSPVSASAVAGVTSPGRVSPAGLFPFALSECMYRSYWDANANPPSPIIKSPATEPPRFEILSVNQAGACEAGQWTPLNFSGNNANQGNNNSGASVIKQIIEHDPKLFDQALPASLAIGDPVPMQQGVDSSGYIATKKCIGAKINACDLVVMPVVDRVDSGGTAIIRAFACLKILDAFDNGDGNNKIKTITVQMSNECKSILSDGAGPNYGVLSPPSLFK